MTSPIQRTLLHDKITVLGRVRVRGDDVSAVYSIEDNRLLLASNDPWLKSRNGHEVWVTVTTHIHETED